MERIEQGLYIHAKEGCYLCPRNADLIDTGMEVVGEGVLAICLNCLHDMNLTAGFVVNDDPTDTISDLTGQVEAAEKRADRAEDFIVELTVQAAEIVAKRQEPRSEHPAAAGG